MFSALLVAVIPTIIFFIILSKLPFLKSLLLKVTFSWFLGQVVYAWITFLLATGLSFVASDVLQKASLITLTLFFGGLWIYRNELYVLLQKKMASGKNINGFKWYKFVYIIFLFVFSYLFFHNQLALKDGVIYTSPAYWDFQWHMPLIQNFVYGDNFPVQNESFSGIPATYHFFWGLLVAIYSSVGLGLISAINFISIVSLFFVLAAITGISEEIFNSFKIGSLAVLFTVTTSSLHFLSYFTQLGDKNPFHIINSLLTSTAHPYLNAALVEHSYGYNGNMFNMFYFLAERQMIPGIIFLIFSFWVIYNRKQFNNIHLLLLGSLIGLYFLWHLYITIMVLCALLFIFIFGKDRKKTLLLLGACGLFFLLHVVFYKNVQQSGWFFSDIGSYPRINVNFPTLDNKYPFSISQAVMYYVYSYGFKIPLLLTGLFILWKKNKKVFLTVLSVIIPTFLLINTVQLSPLSIYDNHKWLRPMNIIVDIVAAYGLILFFFGKTKIWQKISGVILILAVTLSGLIELPPFINAKPKEAFANTKSQLVTDIRSKTPPKAVFIGDDTTEIQLAGRKLFLGDYSGQDLRLDKSKRLKIIQNIYRARTITDFCKLTNQNNIQYVEKLYPQDSMFLRTPIHMIPHIRTINQNGIQVIFIDIVHMC